MEMITCRDIEGNTSEVPADSLLFRPSVYGVIIEQRNGREEILLVPSWAGWDFPGGGIKAGEPTANAFTREIFEETGMTARTGTLLRAFEDFFIHPKSKKAFHSFLFYYTHESISGDITDAGFTDFEKTFLKKAEWVPVETILSDKFWKFCNPADSAGLIRQALTLRP